MGMTIGKLSKQSGCPIDTIRFYEREGLLPSPDRSDGNYRLFSTAHFRRLRFILRCRSLDMSLGDIASLLRFQETSAQDCGAINTLLDEHIRHIEERMLALKELDKQLKSLRRQCRNSSSKADCGILRELSSGTGANATQRKMRGIFG